MILCMIMVVEIGRISVKMFIRINLFVILNMLEIKVVVKIERRRIRMGMLEV